MEVMRDGRTDDETGQGTGSEPTRTLAPPVFAGRAWQQVLRRDASADGEFVYAVRSTGIYCRPSCPSRRPQRRNVQFFPTPAMAEAAGFRPCLRCEPLRTTPRPDPQAEAIARAAGFLADHAGERTTLEDISAAAGLGKFALQRGFKRVLGVTPAEFARQQRKERFRSRVRKPSTSVTEAVYEAGFGSSSRLYEGVHQTLGMSPTAMKSGGAGETIHYTTTESPLGRLLIAATGRGLCAVLFAGAPLGGAAKPHSDTDADLVFELRQRFPQAILRASPARAAATTGTAGAPDTLALLGEAERLVLSHLTEHPSASTLPFHIRATAFQQRVWQALLRIPRGETRTYAEIAQAIGAPKSVRAVGTACGANPLAVVIPCHRVVGADGRLTGYRWGVERKQRLLELEAEDGIASAVQAASS